MFKHGWIGAVALGCILAGAARAEEIQDFKVLIGGPEGVVVSEGRSDVLAEMGEYWLGLVCSQLDAPRREKLGVPADRQGLLVEDVAPDSPAAKAGFRRNDVLLKANDKPLEGVADLIKIINQVKEGKLSVELLREGKTQTIAIAPAKRPAGTRLPGLEGLPKVQREEIEKWLEKAMPGEDGKALRFHFLHPGTILPPGTPLPAPLKLPENMTVTITREGSKPARVTVKQGDETWEATEKELNKLPEKVRPYVESMLPPARIGIRAFTLPAPAPGPGVLPAPEPRLDIRPFVPQDMEKQLRDMNRQIEQLRKSFEELRAEQHRHLDSRHPPHEKPEAAPKAENE